MGTEIKTSDSAAQKAMNELKGGADSYTGYKLLPFHGMLPVKGSAVHDGDLASLVQQALGSYGRMIAADVAAIGNANSALKAADQQAASSMQAS